MYYKSTSDVPSSQKLNYMHEACREALVGFEVRPLDVRSYEFSICGVVLGGFSLLQLSSSPCVVVRKADPHPTDASDSILLQVVLSGEIHIEQGGNAALLKPGDSALYSADRPAAFTIPTHHELAVVKIPRRALLTEGDLSAVTGRNLSEASHIAPILYSFVTNITQNAARISNHQIERLIANLAGLIDTAIETLSPHTVPLPVDSRLATLDRVKAYILYNLRRHDLSPEKVAEATQLSSRYLNRLLEADGTSLSRFIWQQRLERAAEDLASAEYRKWSIANVAYNCGFRNISHFSTAFRERFQKTPRAFREESGARHKVSPPRQPSPKYQAMEADQTQSRFVRLARDCRLPEGGERKADEL